MFDRNMSSSMSGLSDRSLRPLEMIDRNKGPSSSIDTKTDERDTTRPLFDVTELSGSVTKTRGESPIGRGPGSLTVLTLHLTIKKPHGVSSNSSSTCQVEKGRGTPLVLDPKREINETRLVIFSRYCE